MVITDIKIRKLFDDGPMKAIVSVTFDSQLALHDVKVINVRERHFIVMPSRKNPDGTYRDIVHPINAEFRAELEKQVLAAYEEEVARAAAEAAKESSDAEIVGKEAAEPETEIIE
ncbi:MAG: SpoVG family protein [Clostridia bacterium]|nr:SpoVG family protein [Clostridia bacterium]